MSPAPLHQRLLRTYRTVRHLGLRQVSSYVIHGVRRRWMPMLGKWISVRAPRWKEAAANRNDSALEAWARGLPTFLFLDGAALDEARSFADGRPCFLSKEADFTNGFDWGYQSNGRLWEFHLHYLDALPALAYSASLGNAEDLARLEKLTLAWRTGNPPGHHAGWEPYPTSLRVVNLLRACALLEEHPTLRNQLLEDVAVQAGVLNRCLETHLRANHLFANLKALMLTDAVLPDHPGLSREKISRWLRKELDEQFLEDGGHCERSPMYHALLAGDLAELSSVLNQGQINTALKTSLTHKSTGAIRFLETIRHPDGGLPFFNDGNLREVYRRDGLLSLLGNNTPPATEGTSLQVYRETGFVVVSHKPWKLIWDCGPIGPNYQPGHAHADILSFELSYGEQRLFTNSGVGGYADDKNREYTRSTRAHNTVQLADAEQIELWSSFRVGRRARPTLDEARVENEECRLSGTYIWPTLEGSPTHQRRLHIGGPHPFVCRDEITGLNGDTARAYFHLHPDIQIKNDGDTLEFLFGHVRLGIDVEGGTCRIEDSLYSPGFGTSIARNCLVLERVGDGALELKIRILQASTAS